MAKKKIRLTETQLHNLIKKCVMESILNGMEAYKMPSGAYDEHAFRYDSALNTDSIEDFDADMRERDTEALIKAQGALNKHPQRVTSPNYRLKNGTYAGGMDAYRYSHIPSYDQEKGRQEDKERYGF